MALVTDHQASRVTIATSNSLVFRGLRDRSYRDKSVTEDDVGILTSLSYMSLTFVPIITLDMFDLKHALEASKFALQSAVRQ